MYAKNIFGLDTYDKNVFGLGTYSRVILVNSRPRSNVPSRMSAHYKKRVNGRSQDRIVTIIDGLIGKSRALIGT